MAASTAVRTPLHAARILFQLAGFRWIFISLNSSHGSTMASNIAAFASGVAHHSGMPRIRGSAGMTACAASRIISENSRAVSVDVG